jgi:predicted DCC family thiol-disulfide oxidoreductase YuxK
MAVVRRAQVESSAGCKVIKVHTHQEIIVIYDGECRICRSSLEWLQQKISVTALPFQSADLNSYGLTREQCSAEVWALYDDTIYSGSSAIAFLLNKRGNTFLSWLILRSRSVGRFGYRWIATHRNSLAVRIFTSILERSNTKYKLIRDA